MVQVLSKLSPIGVTCQQYVHPWTDSCAQATCGLFLYALGDSLRIYSTVYILALIFKGKIPTLEDVKKTLKGILRSSAFLSFTAFGFSAFLCTLRALMGNYNIASMGGLPAFLSSVFAILIERPSRRLLLALYVSNVATETVWNMLIYRNMVKSIKNGQVAIFAGSLAILLGYYKAGLHKSHDGHNDSMFNILKFVLGPYEEKNYNVRSSQVNFHRPDEQNRPSSRAAVTERWQTNKKKRNIGYSIIMQAFRLYRKLINNIKSCDRHTLCPHPFSCVYYILQGSTKMFSIGLSLQLVLKVALNLKTIIKSPKKLLNILFKGENFNISIFLGGVTGLFRFTMCMLRRFRGTDDPIHAVPAGIIAGLAFCKYPDTTIALYVFWKMLQVTYNLGIDKGYLPNVPGFTSFLYCFSTAILFHAAMVEPINLRSSYWKFLHSNSGGRIAVMTREAMDVWGLETSKGLKRVLERTRTKPEVTWYLIK